MILAAWFIAFYPGFFTDDQTDQIKQAYSGNYNDWHPVWHTLIFFTFPIKVFGIPQIIVPLQLLYFSLIMGSLFLTISEMSNLKIAAVSFAIIIMNPYIAGSLLCPIKDVAFAMTALLSTIMCIRLMTVQKHTLSIWYYLFFGIITASATIFRHNAVLYTAPLLIVLFFNIDKKIWIRIMAFTLAFFLIIKLLVYHFLNVEAPGGRVLEVTGLPNTVIASVAKNSPEAMDEELSDFVYSLAPQEIWDQYYETGNFNSVKWPRLIYRPPIEEQGVFGMLHLMAKSFSLSPKDSLFAVIELTNLVYGFETGTKIQERRGIVDNPYGLEFIDLTHNRLTNIAEGYAKFFDTSLFKYLKTYGIWLFALLTVALSRLKWRSWQSWKKVLIVAPILVYDYGTMLLLMGPDSRFFLITFLVAPLLIVYLLTLKKEEELPCPKALSSSEPVQPV